MQQAAGAEVAIRLKPLDLARGLVEHFGDLVRHVGGVIAGSGAGLQRHEQVGDGAAQRRGAVTLALFGQAAQPGPIRRPYPS